MSFECNYSMFVVAGNTWRVGNRDRDLYSHILWKMEYHSYLRWSSTKEKIQTHQYPYALHRRTCAWWGHWSAILPFIWASCIHIHQSIFREEFQKYYVFTRDSLSCCEGILKTLFHKVFFMSMFEGGFCHLWFCLFSLFCMDK